MSFTRSIYRNGMECGSVTIPYKEDALRLCGDKVENVAKVGISNLRHILSTITERLWRTLYESQIILNIFAFCFCAKSQGIGAVNTVIREKDGELKGYNTDCEGALSAIEDGLRLSGIKTCVCSDCINFQ